jgi:hypothetical protein
MFLAPNGKVSDSLQIFYRIEVEFFLISLKDHLKELNEK